MLVARYHARLLAFCRHMLRSREDAEDVLQEVFAAAFNAIMADSREINARPWLYRIARNRSLNHLRRNTAIGVDSMDAHFADAGQSTSEKAHKREEFRLLLDDIGRLPETQRSALVLREMDALSYEQIAEAMDTTVPSVKSLLVRARIGLAEAAEARKLTCDEVRLELGAAAEGIASLSAPVRRHVKDCQRCRSFRTQLRANNAALAAIFPLGPILLLKKTLLFKLGLAKFGARQRRRGRRRGERNRRRRCRRGLGGGRDRRRPRLDRGGRRRRQGRGGRGDRRDRRRRRHEGARPPRGALDDSELPSGRRDRGSRATPRSPPRRCSPQSTTARSATFAATASSPCCRRSSPPRRARRRRHAHDAGRRRPPRRPRPRPRPRPRRRPPARRRPPRRSRRPPCSPQAAPGPQPPARPARPHRRVGATGSTAVAGATGATGAAGSTTAPGGATGATGAGGSASPTFSQDQDGSTGSAGAPAGS